MRKWFCLLAAVAAVSLFASCEKEALPEKPGTEQQNPDQEQPEEGEDKPDQGDWELMPGIEPGAELLGRWKIEKELTRELVLEGDKWEKKSGNSIAYDEGQEPRLSFLHNGFCVVERVERNDPENEEKFLCYDFALEEDAFSSLMDAEFKGKLVTLNEQQLLIYSEMVDPTDETKKSTRQIVCSKVPAESPDPSGSDFLGNWQSFYNIDFRKSPNGDGTFETYRRSYPLKPGAPLVQTRANGEVLTFTHHDEAEKISTKYSITLYPTALGPGSWCYKMQYDETAPDSGVFESHETVSYEPISKNLMAKIRKTITNETVVVVCIICERTDMPRIFKDFLETVPADLSARYTHEVNSVIRFGEDGTQTMLSSENLTVPEATGVLRFGADQKGAWHKLSGESGSQQQIQEDYFKVTGPFPNLEFTSILTGEKSELHVTELEIEVAKSDNAKSYEMITEESSVKDGLLYNKMSFYYNITEEELWAMPLLPDEELIYKNLSAPDHWNWNVVQGQAASFHFEFTAGSKTSGKVTLTIQDLTETDDFEIEGRTITFITNESITYTIDKIDRDMVILKNANGDLYKLKAVYK